MAILTGCSGISKILVIIMQFIHNSEFLTRNKWKDFGMEVDFIYSNDSNTILEAVQLNTKVSTC